MIVRKMHFNYILVYYTHCGMFFFFLPLQIINTIGSRGCHESTKIFTHSFHGNAF